MRRQLFFSLGIILAIAACSTPGGRSKKDTGGTGGETGGETGFNPTGGETTGSTTGGGGDGECTPGQKSCDGNNKLLCGIEAKWGDPQPCPTGTVCNNTGICQPCQPGMKFCQGQEIMECQGGAAVSIESCEDVCFSTGTTTVCTACVPGAKECRISGADTHETWECTVLADQTTEWVKTATCSDNSECTQGICVSPCASDIKLNTNQGCDYYAVDLENTTEVGPSGGGSAANGQFAVIVSNPSSDEITVTVHEEQKGPAVVTRKVPGNGLEIIEIGPRNFFGTTKGLLAWRIKGSAPFVAYQFNPLDNANPVFSNDASLLLPVNALGRNYMVMTASGGGPFITIVGTKNATEVTVTPSAAVDPGPGINAIAAGEVRSFTLDAGEVLNLHATATPAGEETLTGSTVSATSNVVVFAGNVLANQGGRCCADHLEQQMFPNTAWGTTHVATKSSKRQVELDHWRVLALEEGTTVNFTGGVSNPVTLNAGQFYDVDTAADFVVTADKPILVGQFLASSFEILPKGVYCEANSDCASNTCAGAGTGGGMCLNTCQGTSGSCGSHEYCIDNQLLSEPAGGGSCLFRPCDGGLTCPGGATCAPLDTISICLETCFGFGDGCSNTTQTCSEGTPYGTICAPNQCFADNECGGGYCTDAGECRRSCAPVNECGAGSLCIPPGYVSDPTITTGICTMPDCNSDAECDPGHTCVIDVENGGSCQPIGDPAFILSVPAEQYRDEYVFLAPNAYKEDYVNVIAPNTAEVSLDGTKIGADQFVAVPASDFKVARILVSDGAHRITATEPVGIVVYGYHDDVSYGYPGGANLFDLGN